MNAYTLTPDDLLFFRDARPIESAGGHGARWPEPSVVFDAIHAALWRAFPDAAQPMPWEHAHRFGRSSQRDMTRDRTQRFGSLATAGLFPVVNDEHWLFPAPADVTPDLEADRWLLAPALHPGANPSANLPKPLLYPVANLSKPSKESVAPWWASNAWNSYLNGQKPSAQDMRRQRDLFEDEWTTGIGIDPDKGTQDGERIYSAQYLRLRPEVRCGFVGSLDMKQNGDSTHRHDGLKDLFASHSTIIVGGQQRFCKVAPFGSGTIPLPIGRVEGFESSKLAGHKGFMVKWVLLTPAIWPLIDGNAEKGIQQHPGGWLPNWISQDTGRVLLKHRSGTVRRVWDERRGRTIRVADSSSDIAATLVAAVVPKPVPITGWTERLHLLRDEHHWAKDGPAHGPRTTHLAVPAGAVFYFVAKDASHLASVLNWHGLDTAPTKIRNRRSTLMGEKGFGLGVCGTWTPAEIKG